MFQEVLKTVAHTNRVIPSDNAGSKAVTLSLH